MSEMDITKNIKVIESLKCALLTDLAALYENMRRPSQSDDREERMASLLVHIYLLSKRLGIDYQRLDESAVRMMRRAALDENREPDWQMLLKYLNGHDS